MKILITGREGQVGQSLTNLSSKYGFEVCSFSKTQLDVTNIPNVDAIFDQIKPDLVINAAAYTAVNKAENDPKQAYAINGLGPKILANACNKVGIPLFHISTDYVFDGRLDRPYVEQDSPNPKNVYGKSKLEGEIAVQERLKQHIILRTSWVFSATGNNFVKTMLRLGKDLKQISIVDDQIGGPTSANSIAHVLLKLADKYFNCGDLSWGVYHYSGYPAVSWYQFAKEIFDEFAEKDIIETQPELIPIPSKEYPDSLERPNNSQLNCKKISSYLGCGIIDDWRLSLQDSIKAISKSDN